MVTAGASLDMDPLKCLHNCLRQGSPALGITVGLTRAATGETICYCSYNKSVVDNRENK